MSKEQVHGTVTSWDAENGWGVLSSPEAPGAVWAHFSNVQGQGYVELTPGEAVVFTWEEVEQDGYAYRAVTVRRPGDAPVDEPGEENGDAYTSSLHITWDSE